MFFFCIIVFAQVSVGHIVPGGAAARDGSVSTGDEIIRVDGESVIGASHHTVVHLMAAAAERSRVTLTLRRLVNLHPLGGDISHGINNNNNISRGFVWQEIF